MNRRSFLKTVTGFITLPSLAKEKPELTVQKAKTKLRGSDEVDSGSSSPNKRLYDPTKIWGKAIAKDWAERSDGIILNCMNA